ncbi:MAG: GatB/YqeY domain-containing protein [Hyphomicrobiales bacterium]|nr:GatB/YqeY domain-containing protein [Hyphomicrobiales bacterium]
MREHINEALKEAIKAQDKRRMSTLRLINAAIKDRDIAARSSDGNCVDDAEVMGILAKMVKQRHESIKSYTEGGRPELAQQEQEEIDIIETFLPKQLSDEEIEAAVLEVMDEIGCERLKDMGKTMGALKERYTGQMDFGKASQIVKEQIQQRCG